MLCWIYLNNFHFRQNQEIRSKISIEDSILFCVFLTISGVHNSLKRFFQGMIFFWWCSAPLRLHHIKKLEKFIARFSRKLGKTSKNGVFHHFLVPKPKSKSEIENRALWRLLESRSESSCKISEKSLWSILRSGKWRTDGRTIFCLVKLNFWEVENWTTCRARWLNFSSSTS